MTQRFGADDRAMDAITFRKRRALYRACHRGTKEMDHLLGRYAEAELDGMDEPTLTLFEAMLVLPDPDLQNWIFDKGAVTDHDLGPLVIAVRRFHGIGA